MPSHDLIEIAFTGCAPFRIERFTNWRRAIADMIGIDVTYVEVRKPVSLTSLGPGPAPTTLPFIEAHVDANAGLTAMQRIGRWDVEPDDPLVMLALLTVPGGTISSVAAIGVAERLDDIVELMYHIDNGEYGTFDLGRFTQAMAAGLRLAHDKGDRVHIHGGYEPGGWWDLAGAFEP